MKIKNLFYALMVPFAFLAFWACQDEPVLPPAVNLAEDQATINAGGEETSVLIKPTRDWTATIAEGGEWLTVTPSSGAASSEAVVEVKLSADPNEGEDRSVEVTFTAGNINEVLTVTQEGSGGQGGDDPDIEEGVITIAEFLSKPVDNTVYYKLKGTMTDLFNTEYGNFHLVDATGDVLVYGLTAEKQSSNDKSFSTLGLQEGDVIVIEGYRDEHNGEAQVGGAYYIGKGSNEGGDTPDPGEIEEVTIAEFLAKAEGETYYKLTGTVTSIKDGSWGNLTIEDESGNVYVYGVAKDKASVGSGPSFSGLGVEVGDILTIAGKRASYQGDPQVGDAYYISHEKGQGGDTPDPGEIEEVTVEEFLAKAEGETYYKLTGTVTNISNSSYGNLTIEDATGSVYVYGVAKDKASVGSGPSFSGLGVKVGDILTIAGKRTSYNGSPRVGDAYYISHEAGETPENTLGDVVVVLGEKSYYEEATINGENYPVLKLGTSKLNGAASFTIPAGTTKMTLYCVAWSGKAGKLKLSGNCTITPSEISPASNSGASNNSPYTMTVSDSDRYEFTVSGASSETVINLESEGRVILWDVQLD